MKKIILIIFSFFFILSAFLFLISLALKLTIFTEGNLKKVAEKSDVYPLIAGIIRDKIVSDNNIVIGNGQALEILNETVNSDVAKILTENAIANFFRGLESKSVSPEIAINYSPVINQLQKIDYDHSVFNNLSTADSVFRFSMQVIPFKILNNFTLLLAVLLGIALISIASIMLLLPRNKDRIIFVNINFSILFGLVLITVIGFFLFTNISSLIANGRQITDLKLENGLNRVSSVIRTSLGMKLIMESFILFLISIVSFIITRTFHVDKIELIKKAVKK